MSKGAAMSDGRGVEVAIPCFNEEATIGKVVQDFHRALPQARIVVYDNCSTDGTAQTARASGAQVRKVNRKGKGFVVQAIFERSRADVVLMVDGDDTYEAQDAPLLLEPIIAGDAEMTIGTRLERAQDRSFRQFHRLGNRLLTGVLNVIFRASFRDILSGYRAFSRRFLDTVPLMTSGFETETELMLQSLELGLPVREVPIRYRGRPGSGSSKLRTVRDGYRILMTMLVLLRDHRPLFAFGAVSGVLGIAGTVLWVLGILKYPGLRASGVMLAAAALAIFLAGLMLNTVNTRFREVQSLLWRQRTLGRRGTSAAPREPWASEDVAVRASLDSEDDEVSEHSDTAVPPMSESSWEDDRS